MESSDNETTAHMSSEEADLQNQLTLVTMHQQSAEEALATVAGVEDGNGNASPMVASCVSFVSPQVETLDLKADNSLEEDSAVEKINEDKITPDDMEIELMEGSRDEDTLPESESMNTSAITITATNEEVSIKDTFQEDPTPANIENDEHGLENSVSMEEETISPTYQYWKYELSSESSPKFLIATNNEEFCGTEKGKKSAQFLKGCKWAPDGSCLLSCSDDDNLRLFNFPSCFSAIQDWNNDDCLPEQDIEEWRSALKIKEGGLIYDYCWYPLMSSMDSVSSCFLSTSSEAPIHLWDAFTGTLRASYQPFNHLEQLIAARSLAFDPTGESIYSGYEKCIRIFNITRPGRMCTERPLKQQYPELNQYGIVASICVNPALRSFYAVGSFDKNIGLYYEDGSVICLLQGHVGGVTHMKFSSDGMKLFSGSRNDSRLFEWDMRKMNEKYKIYDRVVTTHQRIYFDVTPNDRYLVTGGTDGMVRIYETETEAAEPCCIFKANSDCVNGVSCNPFIPLLATSSGQRHFYEIANDSDDDEFFVKSQASRERSCDIKLWKIT